MEEYNGNEISNFVLRLRKFSDKLNEFLSQMYEPDKFSVSVEFDINVNLKLPNSKGVDRFTITATKIVVDLNRIDLTACLPKPMVAKQKLFIESASSLEELLKQVELRVGMLTINHNGNPPNEVILGGKKYKLAE